MKKELSFLNEWGQFWFTEIYPLCALIGALIGAYYGYKEVEKDLNPWSALWVFLSACAGALAGAFVGAFILSIPYLAIFAAVVYGVYFVGKMLHHLFGDEPKSLSTPSTPVAPIAKPEVQPVVKSTVKFQTPAPVPAYKPKEPTAKQVHIDFTTTSAAILILSLILLPIYLGMDKKPPSPSPSPSTSISQSSQPATPETPKRVVERVIVREHDEPTEVNHNRVTRLDLPAPPLGISDIRTWNDMMAGYVDAPKPKAIAVGSNGVFYYHHGPNAAQRSLSACRDLGGISCAIFEQKD